MADRESGPDGGAHLREPFAAVLRRFREAAGWTQEELAERAGLTSHGISALERGARSRPYPHTVRALAGALELTPAERAVLLAAVPRRRGPARSSADVQGEVPDAGDPTAYGDGDGDKGPTGAPGTTPGTGPAARRSTLPAPLTALVGRDGDVAALTDLVRSGRTRLVTLTGLGGVGKTQLALAVARAVADDHDDAVLVPLAAVEDAALVLPAVGRALGLHGVEAGGDQPVLAALGDRRVLLVLDNLEQLPAANLVVSELLSRCARVVLLATSRAALRVRGETEYAVAPLALPTGDGGLADVEAAPAGALFLARARAVSRGFASAADDAAVVTAVCTRLAGIPLALEIAAARARVLTPRLLLDRLDEALVLEGAADLPERQRTMRATLDWSHALLSEPEQALYRRLGVFTGGATLEAVEAVCCRGGDDVLASLERLVEQSLVTVTRLSDGSARYAMLEPVLQHARSLLTGDELTRVRRRHAEHFREFAVEAARHYEGRDQVVWLERADRDDANLTAAVDAWLAAGDGESAGGMVWALWLYWWLRGRLTTARRLAEAVSPLVLSDRTRVRVTLAAASFAFAQGDIPVSGERWARARLAAEEHGDVAGLSYAVAGEGLAALARGDVDAAGGHFRTVIDDLGDHGPEADWILGLSHVWLGTVHQLRGDPDSAAAQCRLGLVRARRRGDRLTTYVALYGLVQAALARGRHEEARGLLLEGIGLSDETGDLANLAFFLESLAVVEGAGGRHARAAMLLGASTAMRDRVGSSVYGYYLPDPALRSTTEQGARAALGDDAVEVELHHGWSLTPDEAVQVAAEHGGDGLHARAH